MNRNEKPGAAPVDAMQPESEPPPAGRAAGGGNPSGRPVILELAGLLEPKDDATGKSSLAAMKQCVEHRFHTYQGKNKPSKATVSNFFDGSLLRKDAARNMANLIKASYEERFTAIRVPDDELTLSALLTALKSPSSMAPDASYDSQFQLFTKWAAEHRRWRDRGQSDLQHHCRTYTISGSVQGTLSGKSVMLTIGGGDGLFSATLTGIGDRPFEGIVIEGHNIIRILMQRKSKWHEQIIYCHMTLKKLTPDQDDLEMTGFLVHEPDGLPACEAIVARAIEDET